MSLQTKVLHISDPFTMALGMKGLFLPLATKLAFGKKRVDDKRNLR